MPVRCHVGRYPAEHASCSAQHPKCEVHLISPLKTTFKWLYTPYKLREKISKENFIWYLEKASLRYSPGRSSRCFGSKNSMWSSQLLRFRSHYCVRECRSFSGLMLSSIAWRV